MKIRNLLTKCLILVASTLALAGCGEPAHQFVGTYTIKMLTAGVSLGNVSSIEIGDDYIQFKGEDKEEFESITVKDKGTKGRVLVFKDKDGVTEEWKVVNDHILEAVYQRAYKVRLVRQK